MKTKLYLFIFGIVFIPSTLLGQLTSFNAGPEDGRFNICEGETIRLKTYNPYFDIGPNPVTVDWMNSPVPASEKNLVRPTFSPPGPGTYEFNIRMTDLTFPEASFIKSFKIVVVGKPLAKAGNDVNLCIGKSIKLNAVETRNSESIQWTHNGRGILQDAFTLAPTYIPANGELGTVILALKATGNPTCGGESNDELLLNYFPLPTADITIQSPQIICSNTQFKINAIASGNTSFKWHVFPNEKRGNLKDQNTLTPIYTPEINESGTVSIILESIGLGCSVFDTLEMRVSQTQVVSSSANGIVAACPGEMVNLFVTTTPDFTYLWSTGAKTNGIIVPAKSSPQAFSVVATNQDGCSQKVDFTIEPKPAPTADFTVPIPPKICSNQTFDIKTAASGYVSFKWHIVSKDKKGILLNDNTLDPTYVPKKDESGLVQIILETIGSQCSTFDTLNLNISQFVVETSHFAGQVNACAGENINMFVTTTPGCKYLWSTGAQTNSINVIAKNQNQPYSVLVTNPDGCTNTTTFTISSKPSPTAEVILLTNEKLCSNKSFKIQAKSSGYNSFKWTVQPTQNKGSLSETNTLTPTYTPAKNESGIVKIIFEALGSECISYDTLSLSIEQMNIEPSHPGGNVLACNNEDVSIFVTSSPGLTYLWSTGAKTNGIIVKAKSPSSSYSVEVTNINGCKEIIPFTITTKPTPIADIAVPSVSSICSNQSIKLQATASGYSSFTWYVFPTNKGTLLESNSLSPTYVPKNDETGDVMVILETIGTQCTVYDTLKLKISQIYTDLSHPDGKVTICEGDAVTLSVTGSPNYSYLWNNGLKNSYITVKPPAGTSDYSVVITNKDGCTQTTKFSVNVLEQPSIALKLNSESTIITVEPPGLEKYKYFGKNKLLLYEGKSNSYDFNQVALITDTLYVIAYSKGGCNSDYNGIYTNYLLLPKLKKVDAFSPNGDGVNDLLMPGRKTQVIDRTSKVLYEGWTGWDGTYLNKEMPQGTYFYLLYDKDGKIYYKGPVTLLRDNTKF